MSEGLSKLEMETVILYNEEENTASVYTHNTKLMEKLERLAQKYPSLIYPEKQLENGAATYIVPKRCVCIREPFSDARRKAASEAAKKAGIKPPGRSRSSRKTK